ncbi:MAG TPA: alpha/beta hydrolase [Pseudomonadales bacterium]|nr:alpha/beta hydrolase [Pseudomonadales bacterium]
MEFSDLNIQQGGVEVNGLRIAYQMVGDPNGDRVLALHGWLDNSASFSKLFPLLKDKYICAMDFAGHGLSDHRPAGTRYHQIDHLYEIDGVLDHLGWDRCSIIGHSMGAGLGAYYTSVFPERIARLILLEGLAPPSSPAEEAPSILRKAIQEHKKLAKKRRAVYSDYDDAVAARMMGAMKVSKEAAEVLCSRGLKQVEGGWTWRTDPRLMTTSSLRFTEELIRSFLGQIKSPTMLVIASDGLLKHFPSLRERVAQLDTFQIREIAGGHHFHLEDEAGQVAAEINRFWAE